MSTAAGRRSILIAEDDAGIARGLQLNLDLAGFHTEVAADGEAALAAVARQRPDLLLLDILLPRRTGLEVLDALRGAGDRLPVIVLSARQDEYDKVAALRLGADDYVTKPFGVAELMARIDAVLRRAGADAAAGGNTVRFGAVRIDLDARKVFRGEQEVPLTRLEYDLLVFLQRRAGRVFTREDLLRQVWDVSHSGSPRTVDNFVLQLRNKLEDDPAQPRHIVTVRGAGYRFEP